MQARQSFDDLDFRNRTTIIAIGTIITIGAITIGIIVASTIVTAKLALKVGKIAQRSRNR